MDACREFRLRLEAALVGELQGAPVAWHAHLATCAECRAVFEAEEALDALLACLPHPELPVALAQRVLRRLERETVLESKLDAALDQALTGEGPPVGLAGRVLAGVRANREQDNDEAALDGVLGRLPEPEVPVGLASRVLAGLELEPAGGLPLEPAGSPVRRAAVVHPFFRFGLAAAATVLAAFIGYRLVDGAPDPVRTPIVEHGGESERGGAELATVQPDPELLASLELLEEWEFLVTEDVDVVLGSLDESEAELLLLGGLVAEEEEEG